MKKSQFTLGKKILGKVYLKIRQENVYSIILPLFVLIMVFILAKKFLLTELSKAAQSRVEFNKNKKEVEILKKKALFLQNLEKVELDGNVEKVNRALPFDKDIASILNVLDYLKEKTAVTIEDINLRPGLVSTPSASVKKEKAPFFDFTFSLSLSGGPSEIEKFIEEIYRNARLFEIEKLTIKYLETGVEANLTLNAFYLPPPKEFGTVSTPLLELSPAKKQLLAEISKLEYGLPSLTFEGELKEATKTVRKTLFSF